MKRKRVKSYWLKKKEPFQIIADARSRAKTLRENEHTAHVIVQKSEKEGYVVEYSIAKWYADELEAMGITL